MIDTEMRAARVHRRGAADFSIDTVPAPTPGPGQLLVRVESAGVNFSDVKRRRGDAYPFETDFPFTPGGEIAGTVVAHGVGVDSPPVGARVFALAGANGFGGYAQYAVAYAPTAVPIPEAMSFDQASVLIVAGATAKVMLTRTARLQPGQSVLIPAATGGVGSFALQIARQAGAGTIIAAVGDAGKGPLARDLGAHEVVDYTRPDWPEVVRELTGERGVDVALEAMGSHGLIDTLRALASFGQLVVYGAATGVSATLDGPTIDRWLYAPASNQSITGFNIGSWFLERPAEAGAALMELAQDVLSGAVRLPPINTLPLAQAREAHLALEERRTAGKLVIKPWA